MYCFKFQMYVLVSDVCMFLDLPQCWSEAAAVSRPGLAQEIPYTDPGWSHRSRGSGDRRSPPEHHPQRVFPLYRAYHCTQAQHHFRQFTVSSPQDQSISYTGAGHIIRISSKSWFISLIPFKKWNLYNVYIHSTQTDIFQVFISFNFDDYKWQLMKTPNSILKTPGATL